MDYEQKYKAALERASKLRVQNPFDTVSQMMEYVFPELAESEDEKIRKTIIRFFKDQYSNETEMYDGSVTVGKAIAWLEKQGEKPHGKTALEAAKEISPAESLGISPEKYEEIVNECIYGSDNEQILSNSAKTCKNDTLLDLLQKMPSCITVDGIDYHFVMKKTSIYLAYYACYNGNGEEGRGNAIFGITAHSPIDLLTEMLEILKEKGLLK